MVFESRFSMDLKILASYIAAARPWTFTASVVPTLLTCIILLQLQSSRKDENINSHDIATTSAIFLSVLECISVIICIQAASNYINTYFDFISGRDTKKNAGDRALVDNLVDQNVIYRLAILLYTVSFGVVGKTLSFYSTSNSFESNTSVLEFLINNFDIYLQKNYPLAGIFILGSLLSFFYTATDCNLKSLALGDVTIFVCFGPLLMAFTGYYFPQCLSVWLSYYNSINVTTHIENPDILPWFPMLSLYTILVGTLTECILHVNNSRDIEMDKEAKIQTVAIILGYEKSRRLFCLMLALCYGLSLFLTFNYHGGNILALLTLPITFQLVKRFKPISMDGIDENMAQLHLIYGLLTIVGVWYFPYPLKDLI